MHYEGKEVKNKQLCKQDSVVGRSRDPFDLHYCLFSIRFIDMTCFISCTNVLWGMLWRSWLRTCTTSRKVADSIPDGTIGILH